MKNSGTFRATAFAAVFLGSIASAGIPEAYAGNSILEALNQRLIAEGFEIVSIKTTFLRRLKIEAHAPGIDREIVLAPGTGAILRDEQKIVDAQAVEIDMEAGSDNSSGEVGQNNSEPKMDIGNGESENDDTEDDDTEESDQEDTSD